MRTPSLLLLLAACSTTAPEECLSGSAWTGGNEESPLMNPGQACIDCHQDEGPKFVFAGTVYGAFNEPDDCDGVASATVTVTDAEGAEFTATSNRAGNFYVMSGAADVVFPITATVTAGDTTSVMVTAQPHGDCNVCHGETGSEGAPGRIVLQ